MTNRAPAATTSRQFSRQTRTPQRGAALLLAMIIMALVATATAGMVWHQSRAIQIEAAERART